MHSGERRSPSLAAMTRREAVRDFLAGKTNTVYGDIGNWRPTEKKTKHSFERDPEFMPGQLFFPSDGSRFPGACPPKP